MDENEKQLAEKFGFKSVSINDGIATLVAEPNNNVDVSLKRAVSFIIETSLDVILDCGQWQATLMYAGA